MSATSCETRAQGISGDAQRLEHFGGMLFLKIMADKDQGLEPIRDPREVSMGELGRESTRGTAPPMASRAVWSPTLHA